MPGPVLNASEAQEYFKFSEDTEKKNFHLVINLLTREFLDESQAVLYPDRNTPLNF